MAHAHHPHFLTHAWFDLHPALIEGFKRYGIPLLMGAALAAAALFAVRLEFELPLHAAVPLDVASDKIQASAPDVPSFGDQFYEQAKRAPIEEMPPQF